MYERNQNKADDHQEKPCAVFAEIYELPSVSLIWIDPYCGERADVFGTPDEEGNKPKAYQ